MVSRAVSTVLTRRCSNRLGSGPRRGLTTVGSGPGGFLAGAAAEPVSPGADASAAQDRPARPGPARLIRNQTALAAPAEGGGPPGRPPGGGGGVGARPARPPVEDGYLDRAVGLIAHDPAGDLHRR